MTIQQLIDQLSALPNKQQPIRTAFMDKGGDTSIVCNDAIEIHDNDGYILLSVFELN